MAGDPGDFTIIQGATFRATVRYLNPDRSPRSLAGFSPRMIVMIGHGQLDSSDGSITLTKDDEAGTIAIRIGADVTTDLVSGYYDYRLVLVADNDPTEVIQLLADQLAVTWDGR